MKRNQNFDYNRSQKVLSCRYNMDINRVEARFRGWNHSFHRLHRH